MDSIMQWIVILIVAPLFIGYLGPQVRVLVLGSVENWPVNPARPAAKPGSGFTGIRRVYWITYAIHAPIVGCLVGLVGYWAMIPRPDTFGTGLAGAVLAYGFAGVVSVIGYNAIVTTIRRAIASAGAKVSGAPTPASADASAYDQIDEK